MIDLLLLDANVALPDGTVVPGSIAVDDGRIVELSADPHDLRRARETVDLAGRLVLPGMIDTHVHVGFHSPEHDVETETRSAAIGGVTTVCRYYRHLGSYGDTLAAEIDLSERASYVDFAFHLGLLTEPQLAELPRWIAEFGIRSFKMYTCYKDAEGQALGIRGQDDGFLFDALRLLADAGEVVANVHAENQEIIARTSARLRSAPGERSDLVVWSEARPPVAEAEAVRRVAFLAGQAGAEVFIPHVSSDAALEAVVAARGQGVRIAAETCPHYLALDAGASAGVLAKINPPIRPRSEAAHLWEALRDGALDVVGSDHGTTMRSSKHPGDPWSSSPGFPGIGTMLPVLLNDGVAAGRIDVGRIATLQARAAELFRLPGKGRIAVGADADLVVVDLARERVVEAGALGSASDFSVFEGLVLRGWPVQTYLRGRLVARDGALVGAPGGRYLRR